jgi:sulfur relay (sulfurtransferase) complex TusBCD TusD component (DsrE family)
MKFMTRLLIMLALVLGAFSTTTRAAEADPLFINLTTDDPHRAHMGLSFGGNQMERGHPLTIFLNDRGVLVGTKAGANRFAGQHKALVALIDKGATVLICPMCMKHYGVNPGEVLPGIKVGNPDLMEAALFRRNTRTLTW